MDCVDCQERRFVIGILISVHIVVRLDVINTSRICLYDSIEKSLENCLEMPMSVGEKERKPMF